MDTQPRRKIATERTQFNDEKGQKNFIANKFNVFNNK
jgi:hypothetical protein